MMMPGTVCMTTHGSRPEGMFCSSSRLTVVDVPVFFGSMTGVSAVTCTCVATLPSDERRPASGTDSARYDGNVVVDVIAEARERHLDVIRAGGEIEEVRDALRIGRLRDIDRSCEIDRCAGKHGAGRIRHRDIDAAVKDLRRTRHGQRQHC